MHEELLNLANSILDKAVSEWKSDSNFESGFWCGKNGPYKHFEPPLRSLCHYGCLATLVGKEELDEDVSLFLNSVDTYILSCIKKPLIFRNVPNQDYGNGVIGAAWLMEYVRYSQSIDESNKKMVYEFIQREFIFDPVKEIYRRQLLDASFGGGVDATFNHQLWFVAELSLSPYGKENIVFINKTIKSYSNNKTYFDNTIYHKFSISGKLVGLKYSLKRLKFYPKSVAYNLFNLIAIKRLISSGLLDSENLQWLSKLADWKIRFWHIPFLAFERHGVSYNPVALEAISLGVPIADMLLARQLQLYKDILDGRGDTLNNIDSPRLLSRFYEVFI